MTLPRSFDVVALREVPAAAPAGAFPLGLQGNIRSYLWPIGQGQFRCLSILDQPSRNLGISTAWNPDEVIEGSARDAQRVRPTTTT